MILRATKENVLRSAEGHVVIHQLSTWTSDPFHSSSRSVLSCESLCSNCEPSRSTQQLIGGQCVASEKSRKNDELIFVPLVIVPSLVKQSCSGASFEKRAHTVVRSFPRIFIAVECVHHVTIPIKEITSDARHLTHRRVVCT